MRIVAADRKAVRVARGELHRRRADAVEVEDDAVAPRPQVEESNFRVGERDHERRRRLRSKAQLGRDGAVVPRRVQERGGIVSLQVADDAHASVRGRSHDYTLVRGREGAVEDVVGVPRLSFAQRPRAAVPDDDLPVVGAGHEARAVVVPAHRVDAAGVRLAHRYELQLLGPVWVPEHVSSRLGGLAAVADVVAVEDVAQDHRFSRVV
mmetsp:Transcript_28579/g.88443  ORF Transcript_28579/g.88443 Transcript_28579/m.88443 type:complete len:208 (+) Transcript_28579:958-1581(+)